MAQGKYTLKEWVLDADKENIAVLAVVFTDINGSVALYHKLGDETMGDILDSHFTQCETLLTQHRGWMVGNRGDGLLVVFRAVTDALDFVLALRDNTGHDLITIHAGVDVGPVVMKDNHIFGGAVNYAARLEDEAVGSEILLSDSAKTHINAYRAKRHAELEWNKRLRGLKDFGERWIFSY